MPGSMAIGEAACVSVHRAADTLKPGERHPQMPAEATDRALVFNNDLVEALELDNMMGQAEVSLASTIGCTESRGAHARDDEAWLKHSSAFRDESGIRLEYRPVHLQTLSNEVASIPPKERVY